VKREGARTGVDLEVGVGVLNVVAEVVGLVAATGGAKDVGDGEKEELDDELLLLLLLLLETNREGSSPAAYVCVE
jgi:hypothetical protein